MDYIIRHFGLISILKEQIAMLKQLHSILKRAILVESKQTGGRGRALLIFKNEEGVEKYIEKQKCCSTM